MFEAIIWKQVMRIEKIRMRDCILSLVKSKLMSHVKTIDDDEQSADILKNLLLMTRILFTEGDNVFFLKWR